MNHRSYTFSGKDQDNFPSFREVPNTGVIYVMSKAQGQGFSYGSADWANLGQGAPETGPLDGDHARLVSVAIDPACSEYSPVAGNRDLRQAVAELYNARYRRGMPSQYTYENVAISSGGRTGLARIVASLAPVHLGHYLPDYTAYEELFDAFKGFVPMPILVEEEEGFRIGARQLEHEIVSRGLGAVLLSNPNNPTGQAVHGDELLRYVEVGRRFRCALIFDEFYSHYLYGDLAAAQCSLSAAPFVEDVDKDMVILVDGLTKNWRYPGLRVSWTLGPKAIIQRIASAGSFLDGGAAHPIQKAVIPLLDIDFANHQARSIQKTFVRKRDLMVAALQDMGLRLPHVPQAGFYCFVKLDNLPPSLQDGIDFFEAALQHKVITVPGKFFDVNPGQRRRQLPSRLSHYARFSFGPSLEEVERGMQRLKALVREARY